MFPRFWLLGCLPGVAYHESCMPDHLIVSPDRERVIAMQELKCSHWTVDPIIWDSDLPINAPKVLMLDGIRAVKTNKTNKNSLKYFMSSLCTTCFIWEQTSLKLQYWISFFNNRNKKTNIKLCNMPRSIWPKHKACTLLKWILNFNHFILLKLRPNSLVLAS